MLEKPQRICLVRSMGVDCRNGSICRQGLASVARKEIDDKSINLMTLDDIETCFENNPFQDVVKLSEESKKEYWRRVREQEGRMRESLEKAKCKKPYIGFVSGGSVSEFKTNLALRMFVEEMSERNIEICYHEEKRIIDILPHRHRIKKLEDRISANRKSSILNRVGDEASCITMVLLSVMLICREIHDKMKRRKVIGNDGRKCQVLAVVKSINEAYLASVLKKESERLGIELEILSCGDQKAETFMNKSGIRYMPLMRRTTCIEAFSWVMKSAGSAMFTALKAGMHYKDNSMDEITGMQEINSWRVRTNTFHRFLMRGLYARIAERILEQKEPKAVVITQDLFVASRAFAEASVERNIPVVYIQHGFATDKNSTALEGVYYCLLSGLDKGFFLERGVEEERIMLLGSPLFDYLYEYDKSCSNGVNDTVKRKRIVFASQPFWTTEYSHGRSGILEEVFYHISSYENLELIVKLHPQEKRSEVYESLASRYGISILLVSEGRIGEYLKGIDLFITSYSTSIIEAVLMKAPVAYLQLKHMKYKMNREFERPLAFRICGKEDIGKVLEEAVCVKDLKLEEYEERWRAAYHEYLIGNDGNAAGRILSFIESLTV